MVYLLFRKHFAFEFTTLTDIIVVSHLGEEERHNKLNNSVDNLATWFGNFKDLFINSFSKERLATKPGDFYGRPQRP